MSPCYLDKYGISIAQLALVCEFVANRCTMLFSGMNTFIIETISSADGGIEMVYRKFKNGDEKPSLLGLGCMRLPKLYAGKQDIDYESAFEILDYAYQNGVNYFDTAYTYHDSTSEPFLAKALANYPRESYYLADKLPMWLLEKEEDVQRIFNEQLKRCNTPYFDFYLCHAMDADRFETMKKLNVFSQLKKWRDEGLIHHIGFSFHDTPEVLAEICSEYDWEFAQIQLNAMDWEKYRSKEQYDILQQHGLPCIVMEPVRGGRLADLGNDANELLLQQNDGSVATWAIRYAASLPNVLTVLSGMGAMQQVEENVACLQNFTSFTAQQQQLYMQAIKLFEKSNTIQCTACQYCMPCPKGVNIPGVFSLYNEFILHSDIPMEGFVQKYNDLPANEKAENCVKCGKCETICPQHLTIMELLQKVSGKVKQIG